MGVYWAKPTLEDIASQRAMLERGEEKRKADWKQAERERLRDTFAAAALTGLLGAREWPIDTDEAAHYCYRVADAMLRERDRKVDFPAPENAVEVESPATLPPVSEWPSHIKPRTNHDAVPEAKANADGEPAPKCGGEAGLSSRDGTGNTHKPVAWACFYPNGGPKSVYLDRPPVDAEPLYRHPPCQDLLQKNFTLTDAEREAVETAADLLIGSKPGAILRKLLARLA